jgi:hypothetical protein
MSAELPIDLDLDDVETARDELASVIVDLAEACNYGEGLRRELCDAIVRLAGVRSTLVRAIDACAGEVKEGSEG